MFLVKDLYQQLKEVHTKRKLTARKVRTLKEMIKSNWRLSVPFIESYNSHKLAGILEFILQAVEAFEKRHAAIQKGGVAAMALHVKSLALYREALLSALKKERANKEAKN